MAELVLHHAAPSRSSATLWMLEEVGQPYRLELLDLKRGENRLPGYLAVNPMGKVPALRHGDVVVTEAAAICAYLADSYPSPRLAPLPDDRLRGPYLRWMFFGPSCLEPAILDRAYPRAAEAPRGATGYGDLDAVIAVLADAVRGRATIVGDRFTAADVVIGSGLRWGMMFKIIPERPEFLAYTAALAERPALRRALARDEALRAA